MQGNDLRPRRAAWDRRTNSNHSFPASPVLSHAGTPDRTAAGIANRSRSDHHPHRMGCAPFRGTRAVAPKDSIIVPSQQVGKTAPPVTGPKLGSVVVGKGSGNRPSNPGAMTFVRCLTVQQWAAFSYRANEQDTEFCKECHLLRCRGSEIAAWRINRAFRPCEAGECSWEGVGHALAGQTQSQSLTRWQSLAVPSPCL